MKQIWTNHGAVYKGKNMHNYESPVVEIIDNDVWRIYYSFQDKTKLLMYGWYDCHISYIEVEAGNPTHILYNHDDSIIKLGRLGTFDNNGMILSSISNGYYMYTGLCVDGSVGIRKSIGILAKGNNHLKRISRGPVLSIGIDDPYSVYDPCVIKIDDKYHMWYTSITKWKIDCVTPKCFSTINHVISDDMYHWYSDPYEECNNQYRNKMKLSQPFVMYSDGKYRMWYVYKSDTYMIGYAESDNGNDWIRMDDDIEFKGEPLPISMTHPHIVAKDDGTLYMFYSGNINNKADSKLYYATLHTKSITNKIIN